MQTTIVTGSSGLIGSETAKHFAREGLRVVGIDNDMRAQFFGAEASTKAMRDELVKNLREYEHHEFDIRDAKSISALFAKHRGKIRAVVHTAAQPSHDWAARDPQTDFTVNANGTLNLLEATRENCPEAPFVFTSTNKVYGDTPNRLPLRELETRWEIEPGHEYESGISETMSIDATKHSLFGASKVAADVLVQEYGRYFGMPTVCFRGGCLTGRQHAGVPSHGFLAYLARAVRDGLHYQVFGYGAKQVRDNLHSADVCAAILAFAQRPRVAAVYNLGGGRENSVSMIEAIARFEELYGRKLEWEYVEEPRIGDHICYISDLGRLRGDYPEWNVTVSLDAIFDDFVQASSPAVT